METKPTASNESVVAELRKLIDKWHSEHLEMADPYTLEELCTRANCADELEPLITQLEASASAPQTGEVK